MAEDVCKTIAFLAAFADELVSMQKQTLEALVKSSRSKQVKEWNTAKNFWQRKVQSLDAEHREVLDDWELVLCDMSYLQPVAFLPRLQRCLDRSGYFWIQHAESIKQLGAKTLQEVLQSRQMKEESMAVFTRLLLERYTEQFTAEQKELVLQWESELCEKSGEAGAGAESSVATSLARVEEFFVAHCGEIAQLSKQTLRDVAMSNQAHKHKVWMQAQKFYIRHVHLVTPEQQELLDDWEFLLCDMSYLQPVAFLPRLQRCLDRTQSFLSQNAESIKQLGAKTLQEVLRSRQMKQESMSVFIRLLMERYSDQFTAEQKELVLRWQAELCEESGEVEAGADSNEMSAFSRVQRFFARYAHPIIQLEKGSLRQVVTSNQANKDAEWKRAKKNFPAPV